MRVSRIVLGGLLVVLLLPAVLAWATTPAAKVGQVVLKPKTFYTKGRFSAYASPWGGEMYKATRWWSRRADSLIVDIKQFPANTRMEWRWPPTYPRNGVGVWGYDAVMFGNYDGGVPEQQIAPVRVRDIKQLRQAFGWSISDGLGEANVLTEFYLFGDPAKNDSKRIELGWFLHAPQRTRDYFDAQPLVGHYVDEQGRKWTVRIGETFCMFAPEKPGDITTGTLDMLHALKWLQTKGKVKGDEWFLGVGIGVEPVKGTGSFELHKWQVGLQ